jgi:glycine cleavage system regulatory protein
LAEAVHGAPRRHAITGARLRIRAKAASEGYVMALLVLSVAGSDRPGLTQALAAAVQSAGGNWLESHLSRLGGLYVGSVLVELEADGVDRLRSAARAVDAHGLEVRIVSTTQEAVAAGEAFHFSLVGQDRPGIVNQVTAVLSGLGANIESLETWVDAGSQSGVALFHTEAGLRLPPELPAAKVQAVLEDISAEIMVDISVGPAPKR